MFIVPTVYAKNDAFSVVLSEENNPRWGFLFTASQQHVPKRFISLIPQQLANFTFNKERGRKFLPVYSRV